MANLDSIISKGQTDVQDKAKKAVDDVQAMGDAYSETKEGLSGMPGGLDSDLVAMIEGAKDQAKTEVEADIEGVKTSAMADAKAAADGIKGEVTDKINANETAKSKMDGIGSKYGKAAMEQAKSALDQNTARGNDLMQELENALAEAASAIEGVKGKL